MANMLVRRINVQNAVKYLFEKHPVLVTTIAPRFISNSEVVNWNPVINTLRTNSQKDGDQIQKRKKTTTTSSKLEVHKEHVNPEVSELMAMYPDLVRELVEIISQYDPNAILSEWFEKVLQYNLPHEKKYHALIAVFAYKQLVSKSQLTPENIRLAQYVAWCVELLQTALQIYDDMMDGSKSRWGQPCWYRMENVGMMSINDGLMIENGLYEILRKHFADKEYYAKLVDLFRGVTFITAAGQCLDVRTTNMDVTHFTMEKFKTIVEIKATYFSFYLPVAASMIMSGITDPEVFRQAKTILTEIGFFAQIQNDFWDCFGDPIVTGKIGTDIEENKCTWLAAKCMQRASAEQKAIMRECYGKKDSEKVARVKELYMELEIPKAYAVYEEESYNMIRRQILETSIGVPHEVFFKVLDMIYLKDS